MKAIVAAVLLSLSGVAMATGSYHHNNNDNSKTYNNQSYEYDYDVNSNYNLNSSTANADSDATGIGVGVGIGKGGNANSRSSSYSDGGNAAALGLGGKSAADASVGDVTVGGANVYSSNRNTVQGGRNDQSQRQSNSNSAVGSGNATTVTVEGDTIPVQKKPDVPAIAPSAIASPATAPCYVTYSGSGAYGGIVAFGGAGFVKDHGCALGEVARRATTVGNDEIANEALSLMFQLVKEEAGLVEPAQEETGATFSESDHPSDDVLWYAR